MSVSSTHESLHAVEDGYFSDIVCHKSRKHMLLGLEPRSPDHSAAPYQTVVQTHQAFDLERNYVT